MDLESVYTLLYDTAREINHITGKAETLEADKINLNILAVALSYLADEIFLNHLDYAADLAEALVLNYESDNPERQAETSEFWKEISDIIDKTEK